MSKGSNRRPMEISNEEFKRQWDQIFGTGADIRDMANEVGGVKHE